MNKNVLFQIVIITLYLFNTFICDESIKSVGYNQCIEKNSIFDQSHCRYFSSYYASVNVVGGGNHSQLINYVGNVYDPILVINDNADGATTCPDGVACTNLNPPITISIVRSPIPFSSLQVIPGGNISFGFAYSLTQDTEITKSGLPYAYQVYQGFVNSSANSNCFNTYNYNYLTLQPNSQQPNCNVGTLNQIDLRGSCGNPSLAPPPTGWLTDNDGKIYTGTQCTELCCGNISNIRVRQLAPYCYAYKASPTPVLVVDFLIVIQSTQLPSGNLTIPIYGSINVGDALNIESNGVRITVQSNQQIPTNLLENTVSNGWIYFCGDNPDDAIPNEFSPVTNIENITWFFQPANYKPYYFDQTNGKAVVYSNDPTEPHVEKYGMSGVDVINLIYNYFLFTTNQVANQAFCNDLSNIFPNVPGYDSDNPILPSASPYNMPSMCNMLHEARSGNLAFLPPASILPDGLSFKSFNWMVKKNIGTIANNNPSNGQSYIIFFPNLDQIAASSYKNDLLDAIQFRIDFANGIQGSNYVTNYGDTSMPVDIVQQNTLRNGVLNAQLSAPSCWFADPDSVDVKYTFGFGTLIVQLESVVNNQQIDSSQLSNPVSNIQVVLSCSANPDSGSDGSTPTINILSDTTKVIPSISAGGVSDPLQYNLSAGFMPNYKTIAVKDSVIAFCTVTVTYDLTNPSQSTFSQDIQCKVSSIMQNTQIVPNPCPFWNLSCQSPIVKSWFFWFIIGVGVLTIVLFAVAMYEFVKYNRLSEQSQELEQKKDDKQYKIMQLQSKINTLKYAKETEALQSLE